MSNGFIGLLEELEYLKIETRLIDERFSQVRRGTENGWAKGKKREKKSRIAISLQDEREGWHALASNRHLPT